MNPRNMGAPTNESSIVDDFGTEERILDSPVKPSDSFPPESRRTAAAQRPALLDVGELPLRQSPSPATTVSAPLRPRRSVIHYVSTGALAAAAIVLALIAGAVVRNRLDVSALGDQLATAVSKYVAIDQTHMPASPDVPPAAEVVRDAATPESTTGTTASRPAPVAATRDVAAPRKPEKPQPPVRVSIPPTRPSVSSARGGTAASPVTPRSLPPPVERRAESLPPPVVPETISPPAVPAASTPPPVPPVSSAAPVSAPSAALPLPVPVSAPTAAPAAAPSTAPIAAAPAAGLSAETRAVAVALDRYQDAFSALDVSGVHAVWPSVDVRALTKAFDQLEEQTFDLEACTISVVGALAEAECTGNARYIRKVGNRALRVEPRRWHFKLRQTNDQWAIDTVDAR